MKQQLNEIKRMQQLAGIITEGKNQSPLEAVAGTLDMVLDDILPEYIERGKTLTGIIPSKEYADEDSWGDSEDFKKALAYIKNNGGEIKVNTKNPTLMFTDMDITYKLKNNGDIKYTVVVPAKKMEEAEKMNEAADYNKVDSILKGTYKRPVAEVDPEIKKMANVLDTLVSKPFGYEKLEDILNALGPIEPTTLSKAINMMKTSVFELNDGDPFYNLITHSSKYTDKGVALSWEDDHWMAG